MLTNYRRMCSIPGILVFKCAHGMPKLGFGVLSIWKALLCGMPAKALLCIPQGGCPPHVVRWPPPIRSPLWSWVGRVGGGIQDISEKEQRREERRLISNSIFCLERRNGAIKSARRRRRAITAFLLWIEVSQPYVTGQIIGTPGGFLPQSSLTCYPKQHPNHAWPQVRKN